jgi:hypothetical protein
MRSGCCCCCGQGTLWRDVGSLVTDLNISLRQLHLLTEAAGSVGDNRHTPRHLVGLLRPEVVSSRWHNGWRRPQLYGQKNARQGISRSRPDAAARRGRRTHASGGALERAQVLNLETGTAETHTSRQIFFSETFSRPRRLIAQEGGLLRKERAGGARRHHSLRCFLESSARSQDFYPPTLREPRPRF